MKIIRLENGSLSELTDLLAELAGNVRVGASRQCHSLRLCELSGLQHYCEEFIRSRRRLLERNDGGGLVLPCPMLLMCGTDDPSLTELGARLQNNVASRACASFSNSFASRAIAYFSTKKICVINLSRHRVSCQ